MADDRALVVNPARPSPPSGDDASSVVDGASARERDSGGAPRQTTSDASPAPLKRTVSEVEALEARERRDEGVQERLAELATTATGAMPFLLLNIIWFGAWIVLNLPGMPTQFDPFPFPLLTTAVSLEAIILAILVLMSENAQTRRDERRNRIEMQVNILAEREVTKILAMVDEIHQHLGLEREPSEELRQMQQTTSLEAVARAVEEVKASESESSKTSERPPVS